jgi:hypothetical protein
LGGLRVFPSPWAHATLDRVGADLDATVAALTLAAAANLCRHTVSSPGQRRVDVVELIDLAHAIGFDPRAAVKAIMKK